MILLAIDTSSTTCAVCIYDDDQRCVLAQYSQEIGRGHAEVLMPAIVNCLEHAKITYDKIEQVLVTIGPGSFTGVRVGMAVARSLGLSLDIPVCGVSTLDACEAFARSKYPKGDIFTILHANRGEAYCKTSNGEVLVDAYANLGNHPLIQLAHLCGSGAHILNETTDLALPIIHQHSAAPINFIAQMEVSGSPSPPEPLYLRKADAKVQSDFVLPRAVE